MLCQRRRRWIDLRPALVQRFVFAGTHVLIIFRFNVATLGQRCQLSLSIPYPSLGRWCRFRFKLGPSIEAALGRHYRRCHKAGTTWKWIVFWNLYSQLISWSVKAHWQNMLHSIWSPRFTGNIWQHPWCEEEVTGSRLTIGVQWLTIYPQPYRPFSWKRCGTKRLSLSSQ